MDSPSPPRLLGRALVDLVAPPRCGSCRRRIPSMDRPWCEHCEDDVVVCPTVCRQCGSGVRGRGGGCPVAGGPIDRVTAPWRWTGTIAAVVRTGKLAGAHAVFEPLGRMLGAHLLAIGLAPHDVVVPVPGHPRSLHRRGFDHAALLARGVATRIGLPLATPLAMRRTSPDRGARIVADATRDLTDVEGTGIDRAWIAAAGVHARSDVAGRVVLVDDVVTTATTVTAAATALRAAGASRVTVAAVARAGGHGRRRGPQPQPDGDR